MRTTLRQEYCENAATLPFCYGINNVVATFFMTHIEGVIKCLFDRAVSAIVLILFSPVILMIAVLVRFTMGPPVLFRQRRPGLRGRPFELLKFRTMNDPVGPDEEPLPDEKRTTPLGKLFRTTSLDELPQFWNVLRGELSLVGPRPLLVEYLSLYTQQQARRHEVKPGITGWAQVNGRNDLTWEEKFKHDVWYVDNQSLFLDLKILILTAARVFSRRGVHGHGNIRFRGTGQSSKERGGPGGVTT